MSPEDIVVTPQGARFMGCFFPCAIGRGGIARTKHEGDGATPAGVHGFIGLLYRPDRVPARTLPGWALPIRLDDGWSDDPADPDYNLMIRRPHAYSHERLWRADPLYDVILLTDWNWPRALRGAGSAIFLHTWRAPGYPTAGCVAFARGDLLWIARRLAYRSRLVVPAA